MTGASKQSPLTVSSVREVPHPPERVYAFVAHMDNHWHVSDRRLRLEGLNDERRGGRIVIAGAARSAANRAYDRHHRTRAAPVGGIATVGHQPRALSCSQELLTQKVSKTAD